MSRSSSRINSLARSLLAQTYLEIGVEDGKTFSEVEIRNKSAVDVRFRFDASAEESEAVRFFEVPSDTYFSSTLEQEFFDIIFIDGLHTFEQCARDIFNSLVHSHARSVIIVDDTVPNDVYSTITHQERAVKTREGETGSFHGAWHGDVFKTVFLIHDFFPTLDYKTIVGSGNPQTVIWRSSAFKRAPIFNNFEAISRLSYFDFREHFAVMREATEEQALKACVDAVDFRLKRATD